MDNSLRFPSFFLFFIFTFHVFGIVPRGYIMILQFICNYDKNDVYIEDGNIIVDKKESELVLVFNIPMALHILLFMVAVQHYMDGAFHVSFL